MNDLLAFARYFLAMGLLLWAASAVWRGVSRHYGPQAEIRRLTEREAALAAQLVRERERKHALTTGLNFADSERSGYVDRTGLEA